MKAERSKPGTVPCCAACGRKLRKARYVLTSEGLSYTSIATHAYFKRRKNNSKLEHRQEVETLTSDGLDPSRGDYGDNVVCGQRCGHALAVRIVRSIPGVLDLLPEAWRHR